MLARQVVVEAVKADVMAVKTYVGETAVGDVVMVVREVVKMAVNTLATVNAKDVVVLVEEVVLVVQALVLLNVRMIV